MKITTISTIVEYNQPAINVDKKIYTRFKAMSSARAAVEALSFSTEKKAVPRASKAFCFACC